jgi:Putative transposase
MAERSAHLVDHVLPDVPIRQWVLSLPYRLRYLLAWDHDLCRAVVGVYVRAVLGFLRARARHNGVADGRSGAVVIIQRFGGALNLNVHVHALVVDGVFVNDGERLRFQTAGRLRRDDVAEVVAVVAHRIDRLLQRRGVMATSEESGGWIGGPRKPRHSPASRRHRFRASSRSDHGLAPASLATAVRHRTSLR